MNLKSLAITGVQITGIAYWCVRLLGQHTIELEEREGITYTDPFRMNWLLFDTYSWIKVENKVPEHISGWSIYPIKIDLVKKIA